MIFLVLGIIIWIAKVVIGGGLVINCTRGLLTRDMMYDRESQQMMTYSQWLGLALGLFLLANAFGLIRLPVWPFGGGLNLFGCSG